MKNSIKMLFVVAMALSSLVGPLHAEETGSTVMPALSSTILGGYVDTSIQGNLTFEVCTNASPAYIQSLKAKRQQMIARFKGAYMSNRCFGGNQQVISTRALFYQLLATNRFTSTTFNFDGFAYYDMPGALSGQYGTLLMPNMQVLRLAKKQLGKLVPVSAPPHSPNPQPGTGSESNPSGVVVDAGLEIVRAIPSHGSYPFQPVTTYYPGNHPPVPSTPNLPPSPMLR